MKKRLRIEVTAFRRRTTIILRDRLEGSPAEPPPRHGEASHTAPADPPRAEGADPNRPQATEPPPVSSEF